MTASGGSSDEGVPGPTVPGAPIPENPWASPAVDYPPPSHYPWDAGGYPPPMPGYQPYGASPPGYPNPAPPPMPGPYGAAPYPPPSYAYPGYAGYPGAGYAMQSGMNTMAMVSLVAGILGIFCCIGSIVSLVCGGVGLSQIKRTHEEGFGLAVAGIVISTATLLVVFVLMTIGLGSR
ncbi:hypothetical protein A5634_25055 [Mycobacterium asiaticum]|uniref:DUF4190 domain-containing protein n=1 Tax=Mycobacterium asiaticum TaxID=1790 RepID=A0A1A3NWJ5_MYCAS|nr:DUF4190 domain-containing protein [Mycobacterium asiaticum]OBK26321.1 hypothetical protein A5634_25055 [Mycobacterium asiaticum]